MPYVDGFLLPVARKNLAAYRRISAKAGRMMMDPSKTVMNPRRMAHGGFKVLVDL
jgi:uncharacterized protein YbaA (DUF1428 family)